MTKTRDLADLGGGFIQAGTGAVQRTVESKLQDVVSVKDFGAVGDGVTDDTTAFTNARLAAASTGNPLLVPQGTYLVGGTAYNSSGGLVYLNDGYTSGVNLGSASQNNQVLVVAETPNTSPIDSTASRVPISVTVVGNGANHASGVRSNLLNKSTDGNGCTGFYGRATNYSNANWGAAVHGETRHNGGTSIGLNSENAGYSTNGSMIGVNVHNTTGTTDLHPEDSSVSDESPATSKAIQILGGATDPGLWAYGLYFNANSIKGSGTAIDLQCTAAYGISFRGATLSTAAIALKDTQQIKFEATNVIALGYNGSAAGGAALEFVNGASVNLRMYNSGICDFRGDIRPSTDNTSKLGNATRRFTEIHSLKYVFDGSSNIGIQFGANSPEGVVTAGIGSLYLRTNGGAGTTLYVKESGTGNTGWAAK